MKTSFYIRRDESGQVYVIIAITVLVVGAVVVGYLYDLCKTKLPPTGTNSVQVQVQGVNYNQGYPTNWHGPTEVLNSLPAGSYFSFQYGMGSSNGQLWIHPGAALPIGSVSGYTGMAYTNEDDTNCYDVIFVQSGIPSRTIVFSSTNMNRDQCYQILPFVERSTNMIDWQRLYSCPIFYADSNYTFSDYSPMSYPTYYRVGYDTNTGYVNQ